MPPQKKSSTMKRKANRAHIEQSLEILVRSMEDGANAVFSTLAQAAAECMDETSSLLPKDEGGGRMQQSPGACAIPAARPSCETSAG